MRIIDIQAIVVRTPDYDPAAIDNTHEAVVVRIESDDGHVGVGEAAGSPRSRL
jgi:L-alanine-DL-glutamate epimerase-like enolase superfamily enzyme